MAYEDFKVGDRVMFLEHYSNSAPKHSTGVVFRIRTGIQGLGAEADGEDKMLDIRMDGTLKETACFRRRVTKIIHTPDESKQGRVRNVHRKALAALEYALIDCNGDISKIKGIYVATMAKWDKFQ